MIERQPQSLYQGQDVFTPVIFSTAGGSTGKILFLKIKHS